MSSQNAFSRDCDWASLELAFKGDDLDSDIQIGMLEEELVPDDNEYLFPQVFPSASTEDSAVVNNVQTQYASCPCCKQDIDTTQSRFHDHVRRCFIEAKSLSSLDMRKQENDRPALRSQIDSIRKSVCRLDLRQRISLMESLSRLAHSTTTGRAGEEADEGGSLFQQDDRVMIDLLYKSPEEQPQKRQKIADLKVECPVFNFSMSLSESTTPILSARPDYSQPLNKSRSLSTPPPAPEFTRNFRPYGKRSRDLVQALSFSPSGGDLQQSPAYVQQFQL